jgi:hypothetical protein
MRERFGTTSEAHLGAQVVSTPLACPALVAWNAHFKSNAVSDAEAGHTLTNSFDNTTALVA